MPTSVAGILVALFAVAPGVPGDRLYLAVVGTDWREQQWKALVRVLIFSLLGLAVYSLVALYLNGPAPLHVFPGTFAATSLTLQQMADLAVGLLGHFVAATIVALVAGLGVRRLNTAFPLMSYPDTWDRFVRNLMPRHWVVVRLKSGEALAGMVEHVDVYVKHEERDLVLEEPALFSETEETYISMRYQHLFLPGSMIDSVATVYDEDIDKRITQVERSLFEDHDPHKEGQHDNQTK